MKMNEFDFVEDDQRLVQGSPEWLEMRKKMITATDATVIMGVNPWRSLEDIWKEKLGVGGLQEETHAMRRGKELEEHARKKLEEITFFKFYPRVVFHKTIPYMMASLDGITLDETSVCEIKCPGKKDHETAKMGDVPEKYYPQIQHILEVTGLTVLHYFSYRSDDDYAILEIPRDQDYIDIMLEQEKKFWWHVENLENPKQTQMINCV